MPEFNEGDLVWYKSNEGPVLEGIITGSGEKDGNLVYDVHIPSAKKNSKYRWGYPDQFTPRTYS